MLTSLRDSGKTLVLTSHSMEEVDALCTTVVIMIHGRFFCIGSPQHLKTKFAQGWTVIVRTHQAAGGGFHPVQPVVEHFRDAFPDVMVFDQCDGFLLLQVIWSKVKK